MDNNIKTWRVHFPNGSFVDVQAHYCYVMDGILKFVLGDNPKFVYAEFNMNNIVGYIYLKGEYQYGTIAV